MVLPEWNKSIYVVTMLTWFQNSTESFNLHMSWNVAAFDDDGISLRSYGFHTMEKGTEPC